MIYGHDAVISVDEVWDGEGFLLTQIEDGHETDQILFDRKCARQIIALLSSFLGDDE